MPRDRLLHPRELIVPTFLAVTALAPGCTQGDPPGPTTEASTSPTSGPTTGPTSTGTTAPTSTAPTGTGTTSGELPDCSMWSEDPETCSAQLACMYLFDADTCILRCDNYKDQATCEMQLYCYWFEDGCYLAV